MPWWHKPAGAGIVRPRGGTWGGLEGGVSGICLFRQLKLTAADLGLAPHRREAWPDDIVANGLALLHSAEDGDAEAARLVRRAGVALGEAAMAVSAVIDPELIVLGGAIGVHPLLVAHVRETLDALATAPTPVVPSALGELAPMRGALHMARGEARAALIASR